MARLSGEHTLYIRTRILSYATQQNMVDRFGSDELIELTDRADPPAGLIDVTVVGLALADADAEIDSYISVRYALPLAATPARLIKVACDIARKHLFKDQPLDEVIDNYKAAVAFLRDVSRGVAELDVAGAEPAGDTTGSPQLSSGPQMFTKDTMGGF